MLNVQTLTNTLSRMPLPDLQKYAALHKNDPYVVSLALSIANQKKQMLAGKAGQAGMQPQPKVVDQALAQMMAPPPQQQMLPEDVGIGQLPAQNMQRMAEGGIVAFDDGGKVPGFAGPTGSYVDPIYNYLKQLGISAQEFINATPAAQKNIREMAAASAAKPVVPPPAVPVAQAQAQAAAAKPTGMGLSRLLAPLAIGAELFYPSTDAEKKASYPYKLGAQSAVDEQAAKVSAANESPEAYAARKIAELEIAAGKKLSPDVRNNAMSKFVKEKMTSDISKGSSFTTDKNYPTPVVKQDGTVPSTTSSTANQPPVATPKPVAAAKPVAPAAPAPAPIDLMTGIKQLDTKTMTPEEATAASSKFGTGAELTAGINQLRADTIASNKALSKAYEEGIAKLPKPGEEAEARLKQREAEDAVGKADAKAMAIFKAGLSMMAGTSQNAFENIGKGAMAGLEDYSASIKDFRKLATERDKAYAEIEAARNAAARDDFKTSMNLQERATDRLSRVNEKGIDVTATLFKTNKEAAATIWNTSNTLASANARAMNEAQMQANKTVFEQTAQTQRDIVNNAAALQRAQIQANAPGAEERILSNPALFNKKMELLTATTGMRGDDALVASYIRNPTALAALEVTDPQLAAQIKQKIKMQMISPINLPADAPVRP